MHAPKQCRLHTARGLRQDPLQDVDTHQSEPASCNMGTVTLTVQGKGVGAPDAIAHRAMKHHFVRKRAANSMGCAQLACYGALRGYVALEDLFGDITMVAMWPGRCEACIAPTRRCPCVCIDMLMKLADDLYVDSTALSAAQDPRGPCSVSGQTLPCATCMWWHMHASGQLQWSTVAPLRTNDASACSPSQPFSALLSSICNDAVLNVCIEVQR